MDMDEFDAWNKEHPWLNDLLGWGLGTSTATICWKVLVLSNPMNIVIVAIVTLLYLGLSWAAEQCAELWDDPEFVELLENAEKSALLATYNPNDPDIEEQAMADLLLLAVYLLQKQFGDEWEDHIPEILLELLDKLWNPKNPP